MSLASGLRRVWLNVHLWLGVALFIPVALLGISGSLLTFQDEFERALTPAHFAVGNGPTLPASRLLESARGAVGDGFVITNLRFAQGHGPVIAQARAKGRPVPGRPPQGRRVWLDPATARVLDVGDPRGGFFGYAHQLHGQLMIPEIGRRVVGWLGWALFTSALTGLWLWLPRNNAFLAGLRWQRGPATTFNLHHLIGFWIAIPLAIVAGTGVYVAFPQSAATFAQVVTQQQVQSAPPEGGGQRGGAPLPYPKLAVDEAIARARAAAPNAHLSAVTLPSHGRDGAEPTWRIDMRANDDATLQVSVSDDDGAAHVEPQRRDNSPAQFMRNLHDGDDQPLAWRIIIFIAGLAPALMGITGIIMWLSKRRQKRAAAIS